MSVQLIDLPQLKGTKEAYELGSGIRKFVVTMRDALRDGWQTDKDLPIALSSAMADLVPAVQGVDRLPEEAKTHTFEFINGLYVPVTHLGRDLLASGSGSGGAGTPV